jgi:HTH-type transcriptional regulator/antitoxin HipB
MFEDIGAIIRFHRKKSGLSQVELAHLAGIGKAAVFDLEHGTKSTRLDTLQKVLKVLNITIVCHSPLMKSYEETKDEKGSRSSS